jgi:hypothetical protein
MIGNIDSQIDDRLQTYSGNPQALQQRYAQTQELVDLLALQKMKNDRAAAANAVQGAMQTDTNTYKGQLEQEAMQGARSDVMRSMGPGIQQQGQRMAQMQNRAAMGLPTQAAPNMQGLAQGGIVGYQEGGGVKRFQEGLAVIGDDESRFGVTTDSGLPPEEAIAMDMQGPEAQQPKFGDELGAQIESGASWLVDYVAENPVEAASYGLMFVPGLNIVRGGIAAMRAAPAIVNAATKVGRAAQKLYTKPRMSGYGSMVKGPKGRFMSAKDAQAAGLRLNRQFSPMRAAGVAGLGLNLGSQLMGGEEGETELPQNEGITAGMYDVRSGIPTDRQKLGSMVDKPSAVLRDNMDERPAEDGGLDIDFRALREFLAGGAGQRSTAEALAGGARGLGAYQTAEQGRQDKINQAAAELQLKRDLAVNEARMLTQKLMADYEGKITAAEIEVAQEALERLDDPLNQEYQSQVKEIREQFARQPVEMENALNKLREAHVQRAVSNVRRGVGLGSVPTTSAAITDMGLE